MKFLLQLRRISHRFAVGMNSQKRVSVGGADFSATKFSPLPRLIPRRGPSREPLAAGIGRGKTLFDNTKIFVKKAAVIFGLGPLALAGFSILALSLWPAGAGAQTPPKILPPSVLLPFDLGFLDSAKPNRSLLGVQGASSPIVSQSEKRVGGGSLYFPVATPAAVYYDTGDIVLGQNNFTIDFWLKFSDLNTDIAGPNSNVAKGRVIFYLADATKSNVFELKLTTDSKNQSVKNLVLEFYSTGDANLALNNSFKPVFSQSFPLSSGLAAAGWNHIAIQGINDSGRKISLAVNGKISRWICCLGPLPGLSRLYFGSVFFAADELPFRGYLDNFRLTYGATNEALLWPIGYPAGGNTFDFNAAFPPSPVLLLPFSDGFSDLSPSKAGAMNFRDTPSPKITAFPQSSQSLPVSFPATAAYFGPPVITGNPGVDQVQEKSIVKYDVREVNLSGGDFTIDFWAKPDNLDATIPGYPTPDNPTRTPRKNLFFFWDNPCDSCDKKMLEFFVNNDEYGNRFFNLDYYKNDDSAHPIYHYQWLVDDSDLNRGVGGWSHFAIQRNSEEAFRTFSLYVNRMETFLIKYTEPTDKNITIPNFSLLYFGYDHWSNSRPFEGYLSNFRITNNSALFHDSSNDPNSFKYNQNIQLIPAPQPLPPQKTVNKSDGSGDYTASYDPSGRLAKIEYWAGRSAAGKIKDIFYQDGEIAKEVFYDVNGLTPTDEIIYYPKTAGLAGVRYKNCFSDAKELYTPTVSAGGRYMECSIRGSDFTETVRNEDGKTFVVAKMDLSGGSGNPRYKLYKIYGYQANEPAFTLSFYDSATDAVNCSMNNFAAGRSIFNSAHGCLASLHSSIDRFEYEKSPDGSFIKNPDGSLRLSHVATEAFNYPNFSTSDYRKIDPNTSRGASFVRFTEFYNVSVSRDSNRELTLLLDDNQSLLEALEKKYDPSDHRKYTTAYRFYGKDSALRDDLAFLQNSFGKLAAEMTSNELYDPDGSTSETRKFLSYTFFLYDRSTGVNERKVSSIHRSAGSAPKSVDMEIENYADSGKLASRLVIKNLNISTGPETGPTSVAGNFTADLFDDDGQVSKSFSVEGTLQTTTTIVFTPKAGAVSTGVDRSGVKYMNEQFDQSGRLESKTFFDLSGNRFLNYSRLYDSGGGYVSTKKFFWNNEAITASVLHYDRSGYLINAETVGNCLASAAYNCKNPLAEKQLGEAVLRGYGIDGATLNVNAGDTINEKIKIHLILKKILGDYLPKLSGVTGNIAKKQRLFSEYASRIMFAIYALEHKVYGSNLFPDDQKLHTTVTDWEGTDENGADFVGLYITPGGSTRYNGFDASSVFIDMTTVESVGKVINASSYDSLKNFPKRKDRWDSFNFDEKATLYGLGDSKQTGPVYLYNDLIKGRGQTKTGVYLSLTDLLSPGPSTNLVLDKMFRDMRSDGVNLEAKNPMTRSPYTNLEVIKEFYRYFYGVHLIDYSLDAAATYQTVGETLARKLGNCQEFATLAANLLANTFVRIGRPAAAARVGLAAVVVDSYKSVDLNERGNGHMGVVFENAPGEVYYLETIALFGGDALPPGWDSRILKKIEPDDQGRVEFKNLIAGWNVRVINYSLPTKTVWFGPKDWFRYKIAGDGGYLTPPESRDGGFLSLSSYIQPNDPTVEKLGSLVASHIPKLAEQKAEDVVAYTHLFFNSRVNYQLDNNPPGVWRAPGATLGGLFDSSGVFLPNAIITGDCDELSLAEASLIQNVLSKYYLASKFYLVGKTANPERTAKNLADWLAARNVIVLVQKNYHGQPDIYHMVVGFINYGPNINFSMISVIDPQLPAVGDQTIFGDLVKKENFVLYAGSDGVSAIDFADWDGIKLQAKVGGETKSAMPAMPAMPAMSFLPALPVIPAIFGPGGFRFNLLEEPPLTPTMVSDGNPDDDSRNRDFGEKGGLTPNSSLSGPTSSTDNNKRSDVSPSDADKSLLPSVNAQDAADRAQAKLDDAKADAAIKQQIAAIVAQNARDNPTASNLAEVDYARQEEAKADAAVQVARQEANEAAMVAASPERYILDEIVAQNAADRAQAKLDDAKADAAFKRQVAEAATKDVIVDIIVGPTTEVKVALAEQLNREAAEADAKVKVAQREAADANSVAVTALAAAGAVVSNEQKKPSPINPIMLNTAAAGAVVSNEQKKPSPINPIMLNTADAVLARTCAGAGNCGPGVTIVNTKLDKSGNAVNGGVTISGPSAQYGWGYDPNGNLVLYSPLANNTPNCLNTCGKDINFLISKNIINAHAGSWPPSNSHPAEGSIGYCSSSAYGLCNDVQYTTGWDCDDGFRYTSDLNGGISDAINKLAQIPNQTDLVLEAIQTLRQFALGLAANIADCGSLQGSGFCTKTAGGSGEPILYQRIDLTDILASLSLTFGSTGGVFQTSALDVKTGVCRPAGGRAGGQTGDLLPGAFSYSLSSKSAEIHISVGNSNAVNTISGRRLAGAWPESGVGLSFSIIKLDSGGNPVTGAGGNPVDSGGDFSITVSPAVLVPNAVINGETVAESTFTITKKSATPAGPYRVTVLGNTPSADLNNSFPAASFAVVVDSPNETTPAAPQISSVITCGGGKATGEFTLTSSAGSGDSIIYAYAITTGRGQPGDSDFAKIEGNSVRREDLSPGQSYTFFARARYYKYGARWSVPTTKFFSIPTNCDSGFDYALTADPARILVTPGGGDGKSTINIKKVSGMFDERTNLYIKQISGQGSSTPDSSQPMPIQLSTGDKKLTAALLSEIKELPPNSLRVKITSQGTDAPFTVRAAADTPVGVYVVTVASNLIPIQTVPVTVDVRKVIATTPSCAAAGEGKTNVSWARVLNATGYAIYRSADGVNFSVITPGALEASAGNISFTDSGLSPKQQYTYKIQSNFASGASEALGAASTAASACSVPKVNLTATPNLVDYGSQSKLTLKATGLDTGADYSCAASADPTSSIWSGDVTGISGDSLNYPIKDDGKGAITGSVASDPLTTTKTFSVRCSRIVNKELVYTTSRVAVKVKLSASCKAEPSVVSSGGIVKWTADPKGGDGAYQYQWNGNDFPSSLTTNPYYYVTYDKLTPSPKTASVAVTSGDGQTVNVNCGNSVTMSPTPIATASLSCAPPGGLPSANPLYLKYGGAATFSWNTNNVTPNSCQLSVSPNAAGWPKNNLPANQNQSDTPLYQSNPIVSDQPSTFTLTCDPTRAVGGGAVSASCAVSAPLACRTVDLKLDGKDGPAGNPVSVDYGYSGRFTWATTNIDDNVSGTASGKDSWSGPKTCQSGVRYSQSTGPFVYNGLNGWRYQLELQCPNPDPRCGNPSDTVYVNVNCQDAGPDFDLLASPATVAIRYIKGVGGSPVSTQTNVSVVADTCRNFNGDVGLSAGPNKLGGVDVVYNFDKQTLPSSGYGAGSNLSVSAKNKPIPEGIYPITITGLSGSLTRTAVINLNVGTLGLKYQEF